MSLSTSNSRKLAALAIVSAALALSFELLVRAVEPRLSFDIQHLRRIPAVIERLSAAPGVRLLFVGNSLTRMGIDTLALNRAFRKQGIEPVSTVCVYPDDSAITEWYYIIRSYVASLKNRPDVVVIPFVYRQLLDVKLEFEELQRIALFSSPSGIADVIRNEHLTFDQGVELVFSRASRSFANRQRVQTRVLDLLPDYRAAARWMNAAKISTTTGSKTDTTMSHLRSLIGLGDSLGFRLVFVAMPLPQPYEIPASALALLRNRDADHVDASQVPGLTRSDFIDGYHLRPQGAQAFSTWLGHALAPLVSPVARRP